MRTELYGQFDESFVVRTGEDLLHVPRDAYALRDRELIRHVLLQLAGFPENHAALRRLVADSVHRCSLSRPTWDTEAPTLAALVDLVADGTVHIEVPERFRVTVPVNLQINEEEGDDEGPDGPADEFRPCDFERVVIKCKHMGGADRTMADAQFWREGPGTRDNLPVPVGGRGPTKVIEVTANSVERDADDITVELRGGPGYNCSRTHPKITIRDKFEFNEVHEGETSVTFKAMSKELELPLEVATNPFAVLVWYYFPDLENRYTIDVESCGRLDDGSYGFGRSQHTVRVLPNDKYVLKIAIPPMKKKTFERARMTRPDGTLAVTHTRTDESFIKGENVTESRSEMSGPDGYKSVDTYKYETRHGGQTQTTTTVTGEGRTSADKDEDPLDGAGTAIVKGISFTRNGADVKEVTKLSDIVTTIATLKQTIQSIADFIKDFQPQVGWKFTFEMELFAGEISAEWQNKEWTDHTVYKYWKVQIEMTLFMLKLEVSFGASLKIWRWEVTALIYGNVSVEAKMSAGYQSRPDGSEPFFAHAEGGPKGELGIRAALGDGWVKAEGKLTVGITFEADAKMSETTPIHIDWALHKDGVKASVTGSVKWVGSIEREWTLVNPQKNWAKGTLPSKTAA